MSHEFKIETDVVYIHPCIMAPYQHKDFINFYKNNLAINSLVWISLMD